ncbi:hypothetical protein HU755_03960 [Pseudomonas sp. SWRI111]|uniref:hypothetical protein n=1 Tax=Pseudomonas sp. SWRI111 TaxID=2745507 RepID=UPI001644E7E0|nr:hypothetical protein [Pseudomonas sp. SWRI111]MBC3205928.1 hypothetical protein [Pseudomonas sp. SWRI111]
MRGLKAIALSGLSLSLLMFVFPAPAHAECTVRLGPAAIDFGSTTRGQLLAQSVHSDPLSFGLRRAQAHVQCERSRLMRLELVGAAADAGHYRFGAGTLQVRVLAVRLDGKAVQWLSEGQGEEPDARVWRPGVRLVPAIADAGVEGQRMEIELEFEAGVASADTRVSDLTRFDSELKFVLR